MSETLSRKRAVHISIVGRPNVGKSTVFNRLAGKKLAIVHDLPGVTRDIRDIQLLLGDYTVILQDTAGFEDVHDDSLEARMRAQTEAAISGSDLCLLVYDARVGITPLDQVFAGCLHKAGKPVIVLANKCESRASEGGITEGYEFGFGAPLTVAAEHDIGFVELQEAMIEAMEIAQIEPESENHTSSSDMPVRIAFVGRPNVGKSTLVNCLTGEDRLLCGPESGMTRDTIRIDYVWAGRRVQFYDTAGLRKKNKVQAPLERLAVGDTLRAIKFAQVVVLLVEPDNPFDRQDIQIANLCIREGRALVIGVNKWDLVRDKSVRIGDIRAEVTRLLPQIRGVPVVMFSALYAQSIDRLLPAIEQVQMDWSVKLQTSDLNSWLAEKIMHHPPPMVKGRRIRCKYISQTKTRPPTFVLKCSRSAELPESYRRYLINEMRVDFNLPAVPVRLFVRSDKNPYQSRG